MFHSPLNPRSQSLTNRTSPTWRGDDLPLVKPQGRHSSLAVLVGHNIHEDGGGALQDNELDRSAVNYALAANDNAHLDNAHLALEAP